MRTSLLQKIRAGVVSLFLLTAINIFTGASAAPAQAFHGIGDLLADVPIVDVNEVTDVGSAAGCGVATATMVLDYWMPQSGNVTAALDPKAVLKYIPTHWAYTDNQGKAHYEAGTTLDQLQQGIEKLSADPTFGYGLPLTAKWQTTSSGNWYTALQAELNANPPRPTILFIPNGHNLGWNWDYGHFIVVSGITSDGNIIYHDPWDGQKHTVSQQAFQSAWGTAWNQNDPWWYLQVQPKGQGTSGGTTTNTPAAAGIVTEFPLPTPGNNPGVITLGPDGNLWFTEYNVDSHTGAIGRITPSGVITEFPLSLPAYDSLNDITTGPDGNLWFTVSGQSNGSGGQTNMVGRITPTGQTALFADPSSDCCGGYAPLTTGSDGNLWIGNHKTIDRMSLTGDILNTYAVSQDDLNALATSIILGPDGNIWFASAGSVINQLTPLGSMQVFDTQHSSDDGPVWDITNGPDGNIWFIGKNTIGYMTLSGAYHYFAIPTAKQRPLGIVTGPDKNLWFTDDVGNKIVQVAPSGTFKEFPVPTANSEPVGITAGPDGAIWFTEVKGGKIGRITTGLSNTSATQAPSQKTGTFGVHADQDWQNTNISLTQGEHVTIQYQSGYWVGSDGVQFDANGPKQYVCADFLPPSQCVEAVPDFTQNALVGKIGGQILKIGDHLDFVVEDTGNLMLRRNNGNCCNTDTTGVIIVQIVISSK